MSRLAAAMGADNNDTGVKDEPITDDVNEFGENNFDEEFDDDGFPTENSDDDDDPDDLEDLIADLDGNGEDDEIDNILAELDFDGDDDDDDDDKPKGGSDFQRFMDVILKNDENKPKGDADTDDGNFTTFFDGIYGDGLDFSGFFDAEADPADINKNINESLKTHMSTMFQQTMAATMGLVDKSIKAEFDSREKTQQAATRVTRVKDAALKALPKGLVKTKSERLMFNAAFDKVYEKHGGNARDTLKTMTSLYRKTNARAFRNTSSTSFSKPRRSLGRRKKSDAASRSKWQDFVDG